MDDKVSLLLEARNFDEGDTVNVVVEKVNDNGEVEKEITLSGEVDNTGYVILKEKITVDEAGNQAAQ